MRPPTSAATANLLLSPMPGTLLSVAVMAGAKIAAGQDLCVVEAMKMQNVRARRTARCPPRPRAACRMLMPPLPQHRVVAAAAACGGGCSPVQWRLQPCAVEAATARATARVQAATQCIQAATLCIRARAAQCIQAATQCIQARAAQCIQAATLCIQARAAQAAQGPSAREAPEHWLRQPPLPSGRAEHWLRQTPLPLGRALWSAAAPPISAPGGSVMALGGLHAPSERPPLPGWRLSERRGHPWEGRARHLSQPPTPPLYARTPTSTTDYAPTGTRSSGTWSAPRRPNEARPWPLLTARALAGASPRFCCLPRPVPPPLSSSEVWRRAERAGGAGEAGSSGSWRRGSGLLAVCFSV